MLAIAFGAGLAVGLLTRPEAHTRTVRATTVEIVNGPRTAKRTPAPMPTLLEGATDPHRLALSGAIPIDANLESANYVARAPRQLIVTWDREHLTRDARAAIWERRGVAIWQLDRGAAAVWHRVYTRETPVNNVTGIEGYDVTLGDASGDGRPEVLIFVNNDGSAGAGSYHLFANVGYRLRQVSRRACPRTREQSLSPTAPSSYFGASTITTAGFIVASGRCKRHGCAGTRDGWSPFVRRSGRTRAVGRPARRSRATRSRRSKARGVRDRLLEEPDAARARCGEPRGERPAKIQAVLPISPLGWRTASWSRGSGRPASSSAARRSAFPGAGPPRRTRAATWTGAHRGGR